MSSDDIVFGDMSSGGSYGKLEWTSDVKLKADGSNWPLWVKTLYEQWHQRGMGDVVSFCKDAVIPNNIPHSKNYTFRVHKGTSMVGLDVPQLEGLVPEDTKSSDAMFGVRMTETTPARQANGAGPVGAGDGYGQGAASLKTPVAKKGVSFPPGSEKHKDSLFGGGAANNLAGDMAAEGASSSSAPTMLAPIMGMYQGDPYGNPRQQCADTFILSAITAEGDWTKSCKVATAVALQGVEPMVKDMMESNELFQRCIIVGRVDVAIKLLLGQVANQSLTAETPVPISMSITTKMMDLLGRSLGKKSLVTFLEEYKRDLDVIKKSGFDEDGLDWIDVMFGIALIRACNVDRYREQILDDTVKMKFTFPTCTLQWAETYLKTLEDSLTKASNDLQSKKEAKLAHTPTTSAGKPAGGDAPAKTSSSKHTITPHCHYCRSNDKDYEHWPNTCKAMPLSEKKQYQELYEATRKGKKGNKAKADAKKPSGGGKKPTSESSK